MKNSLTAFLPVPLCLLLAVFAGCASAKTPRADLAAGTPVPGQLTVLDIPPRYTGGIILVTGVNAAGGTFTYSSKTLQRIPGTSAEIKLYAEVSMIQTPFTDSGEYTVTVTLYEPNDSSNSESRVFTRLFAEGGAVIRWEEGDT
jgi:hypothetical protein